LKISLVAFDKALYRLRKNTDGSSLATADALPATEKSVSVAGAPENGFFLAVTDFRRVEDESQRLAESWRDSIGRRKG
ncbi:hypothetical protein O5625_25795, partial [Escherichia coli]|nr:hypothetical protein [Escherichia coli]